MSNPAFFERQANARRNTSLLVVLFLAAVVLISLAVCLVGYMVTRSESTSLSYLDWLLSKHGLITAGSVAGLILLVSLVRWLDLAGGGERVANMVGARLIDPSTQNQDERRFRNVVEEMAIASGVPVPQLYVMDRESSINAFVAGYTPSEAVMVITQGALNNLSRDELQGVVGHEFSHILNGDMRINIRLIAILAGILVIGQIGSFIFQSSAHRSSFSSRRDNQQAAIAMAVFGLALLVIGYVGVFFGRLIQAAVSRQRELLADASSVQFTRNPEGIASALYKIGQKGGLLRSTSHATDMNHMCFGESAKMAFSSLLASHPPIEKRIEAIQPGMLTRLKSRMRDTVPAAEIRRGADTASPSAQSSSPLASQVAGFASGGISRNLSPISRAPTPGQFSGKVGQVTRDSEQYAESLLAQLPATFRELLYTRSGAIQLCYALVTYELEPDTRQNHLELLEPHPAFRPEAHLLERFIPTLTKLGPGIRFPALELAMPALRQLAPDERELLANCVQTLVMADNRMTLFEFALTSFLKRHLSVDAGRAPGVRYRSYRPVAAHLTTLFSLMARAGTASSEEASQLYQEAIAGFCEPGDAANTMPDKVSLKALGEALRHLNGLSPLLKPAIIDACGHCVTHDGKVDATEYDIMRLVADQLDCPMPPLTTTTV
ncbi:M48 family metallopeptidase [Marinobacter zhejiangensis]|uniref:Zn-dependent protease with chaperone function n=1 Tax=Marinobacter zhejiangensis TaxID=488535 RepID=A0A1I4QRT4_9GAMM|nr:M48 family metallopeptidase [Marinobacter zhejiangensis]SFM42782.1 Zn-dependent protease with chaperone function [Marinobacter zhejiangensis]